MYKTKQIETEVNVKDLLFYVDIILTAKEIDASFSHAFGIEDRKELEIIDLEVLTVYNEEGEEVTNIETIKKVERKMYLSDFANEEFED